MLAKVNTNTYIDVDSITYLEAMYEDEELVSIQLCIGETPLTFTNQKVAQRVLDSYLWHRQNSIYNMIEDTEGYRKKIRP